MRTGFPGLRSKEAIRRSFSRLEEPVFTLWGQVEWIEHDMRRTVAKGLLEANVDYARADIDKRQTC